MDVVGRAGSLRGAVPLVGHTLEYLHDPGAFMADRLERHGPVSDLVLAGRRWTVVIGPDACSEVMRNPHKAFANGPGWAQLVGPFFDRGLMLLDFEEHHRHRRLLQQAFTRDRLDTYVAALSPAVATSLDGWPASGVVHAHPALKELTLDLATTVFMGGAELARPDELAAVNRAFVDCVQAATALVRLPVPGTRWGRALAGRRLLEEFLARHLPQRRDGDGDDLFSQLCRVSEDGEGLDDRAVLDHMIFLLMAAHDTSTITMTTAMRALGRDRPWQERLREQVLDLPEHPSLAELDAVADLDLVLRECLRLVPPVPVLARRSVADTEVLGVPVPAGRLTAVMVHHQHHDARWWTDPERFDPDRFSDARQEHLSHRHAWEPFGGGVHKCLGLFFAGAEVKLLLVHLLRRYRWEVRPGQGERLDYRSLPFPADGQPVDLRRLGAAPERSAA